MSSFIMSIGLASRGQVLFRSTIQRLPAYQKYQFSSLLLVGNQSSVHRSDIRVKSITPNSILSKNLKARNIYSEAALGIGKLDRSREKRLELIGDGRERFYARISKFIEAEDYDSIILEDFINLVALADNEQHLQMIETIAMHYCTSKNWNYPTGIWGPQVLRLYYKMNQFDRAYNNIMDERFGKFFHQTTSFIIALTMMFKSGRYDHVSEIYELSREKLSTPLSLQNVSLVMFATYAKQNTPESFEKAMKLYESLDDLYSNSQNMITMRAMSLLAYLAGNQGKPAVALNIISRAKIPNHIFLKSIRFFNLLRMERYDDMVSALRQALENKRPESQMMFKDVYQHLKEKIWEMDDEVLQNNLMSLMSEIEQKGLIAEDTLETGIFKEVSGKFAERPRRPDQDYYKRPDQDYYKRPDQDNYRRSDQDYHRMQPRNERSRHYNDGRRTDQRDRRSRDQVKSYFEGEGNANDFEGERDVSDFESKKDGKTFSR